MTNKKNIYAIYMLIGICMNLGLYYVAHEFKLPVWMDSIGTAFVAVMLEPTAGLLVAFATNFYQAAVIYDSSSLVYYMVSALAAIVIGIGIRRYGTIQLKRLPASLFVYFVTATIMASLLTIWRTAGVPDSGWERHFFQLALDAGSNKIMACFMGTAVLKAADSIIIGVILSIAYFLIPKKYINQEQKEIVSWKNSYFHK